MPLSIVRPDLVVGLRRLLARRPALRWLVVLACAAVAASAVAGRISAADAVRTRWSTSRAVLVARRPVRAGTRLTADDIVTVRLPPAAVPDSAIAELADGLRARDDLSSGEVVLTGHTTTGDGPAALLPAGATGVGLPLPSTGWAPRPGDVVTVVSGADEVGLSSGGDAGAGGAGTVLTAAATVVAVTETGVLLAVADADAASVATAGATGRAVVMLRPSG